jgi:hypothetical protein
VKCRRARRTACAWDFTAGIGIDGDEIHDPFPFVVGQPGGLRVAEISRGFNYRLLTQLYVKTV